jgi:hypothetical protein
MLWMVSVFRWVKVSVWSHEGGENAGQKIYKEPQSLKI